MAQTHPHVHPARFALMNSNLTALQAEQDAENALAGQIRAQAVEAIAEQGGSVSGSLPVKGQVIEATTKSSNPRQITGRLRRDAYMVSETGVTVGFDDDQQGGALVVVAVDSIRIIEDVVSHPAAPALELRKQPVQARATETIKRIIHASHVALVELGRDEFNTGRVAELAGCSIGVVYRYFPNRIAILDAIFPDREMTVPPVPEIVEVAA